MRLLKKVATVSKIVKQNSYYQIVQVKETEFPAISFIQFVGSLSKGDKVILNTTATELNLGTGGYDFVIAKIGEGCLSFEDEKESHIMKLNYTPLQFSTTFIEESEEYDEALRIFEEKGRIDAPVFVLTIHSHILPLLIGLNRSINDARVTLIIDDSACLPAYMSQTLDYCVKNNLVYDVITSGNSFGGKKEATNCLSAMIYASFANKSKVIVVSPGFGIKGSGKKFGSSAIRALESLSYAESLKAPAFLVPRISFAEKRDRHYGISHHTAEIAYLKGSGFFIPLPEFVHNDDLNEYIRRQLRKVESLLIDFKVQTDLLSDLREHSNYLRSMGRGIEDDPFFFLTPYSIGLNFGVVMDEAKRKKDNISG
ncbi:MAG: DUF3866 family protein [Actinobacteria bacterium]|nr:DUF3866 family protein [Actinomycetota bacterium]